MRHLIDNYYLDYDACNLILKKKNISKKTGKVSYKVLGYYGSLRGLASGLTNIAVMQDLNLLNDLNKIQKMIEGVSDERYNHKN